MKSFVFALLVSSAALAAPAHAQDGLRFDPAQLCAWQAANNGMDVGECTTLEDESRASLAALEAAADADRKTACVSEAKGFSGDSGFASYTVYAGCLKDGPGSL
jgi:hypothetical protein